MLDFFVPHTTHYTLCTHYIQTTHYTLRTHYTLCTHCTPSTRPCPLSTVHCPMFTVYCFVDRTICEAASQLSHLSLYHFCGTYCRWSAPEYLIECHDNNQGQGQQMTIMTYFSLDLWRGGHWLSWGWGEEGRPPSTKFPEEKVLINTNNVWKKF